MNCEFLHLHGLCSQIVLHYLQIPFHIMKNRDRFDFDDTKGWEVAETERWKVADLIFFLTGGLLTTQDGITSSRTITEVKHLQLNQFSDG